MKALLFKTLVFTHRYIGIAIGWLMLCWCLSGLVMMYVSYPELKDEQRMATLAPLQWSDCCRWPADAFAAEDRIASVNLEMLAGSPVLRVQPELGPLTLLDLRQGVALSGVSEAQALQVARDYASAMHLSQIKPTSELIERDQWTVYPRYNEVRPLYHLALNDAAGTELYVSSINGKLVQVTQRMQRFWNWLGSVPHWIYFTALRQNTVWWSNVVIYSSLMGCFLTVFGLFLGVWQLRRRSDGRVHSPYRGWKYWHHVPGLLFGLLVLSWVFSGLMSMTPWGLLEGGSDVETRQKLQGALPTWQQVQTALKAVSAARLPDGTVRIESSVLLSSLDFIATDVGAQRIRHDASWRAAPLSDYELFQINQRLAPGQSLEHLVDEDAFYYSLGDDRVTLPVLRLIANDADATRYYFDAVSGELVLMVDAGVRGYRWLHMGLHRMDFSHLLRARPLWDLWMWLLLSGSVMICATGVWLGVKRLRE